MLENAYQTIFTAALVLLGIGLIFALFRAVLGPRIADRLMGINMCGTMTIAAIAILAFMLKEGYLLDVCLIYCMISFLAVVVLAKVFVTVYIQKNKEKKNGGERRDA
jgi:multicomponent Na+:H+ antiporter subunit F